MGVVAPMSNGVGGDLFAIVYDAKANRLYGLNASGWAPRELTIDFLHRQGLRAMPQRGVHSITVPGAVDGWQPLDRKSTRLNSSHLVISYAVFCLKKKKNKQVTTVMHE